MNYDPKPSHVEGFIHHGETGETPAYGETDGTNRELINKILAKARERRGLTHREVAALLGCGLKDKNQEIYELAEQIKRDFYGNRVVLFAPLYLSGYRINGRVYCLYHAKSKHTSRKKLTQDEIRREVIALQDTEHKRLVPETGEDLAHNPIEYILESINTIYGVKHKNGAIRRISANITVTAVENYRRLKDMEVDTYILFQETYHRESYEKFYPIGPKHDYCYHAEVMDRTQMGGIDDMGCGVLFGPELYRCEFAGLLMYVERLEAVFGVEPHTISIPRIRGTDDIDPDSLDDGIDDDTSVKPVACIRIAVPCTGMIIFTRGGQGAEERVPHLGISQISGGSKTNAGGYFEPEPENECSAQFDISDNHTLDQVANWLMGMEYIPSFCMACYGGGCTGGRFTSLCKGGQIQNCCYPNTLMTLKEYLMDHNSEETRRVGEAFIGKEIGDISKEKMHQIVKDNLIKIEQGIRDLRF